MNRSERVSRSKACLLLGAVGDSLGSAVEFLSIEQIKREYGPDGIKFPGEAYGVSGPITDDTQMTLFAADGLLRAYVRGSERGILAPYWNYVKNSYLCWLATQDSQIEPGLGAVSSELFEIMKSQGRREPGSTCLASLYQTLESEPINNNSKGCGTVMRVAPTGIFASNFYDANQVSQLQEIYEMGKEDAAITHGHENAHNSSGVLAAIIAAMISGYSFIHACERAIKNFANKQVRTVCRNALTLAKKPPSPEALVSLGEGWVAEEALAMSLYCASLAVSSNSTSVLDALRLSVNHGGDSDSTGAITGNLVGVALGMDAVPRELIEGTEVEKLEPLIMKYAERLATTKEYTPGYAPPPHGWPEPKN